MSTQNDANYLVAAIRRARAEGSIDVVADNTTPCTGGIKVHGRAVFSTQQSSEICRTMFGVVDSDSAKAVSLDAPSSMPYTDACKVADAYPIGDDASWTDMRSRAGRSAMDVIANAVGINNVTVEGVYVRDMRPPTNDSGAITRNPMYPESYGYTPDTTVVLQSETLMPTAEDYAAVMANYSRRNGRPF